MHTQSSQSFYDVIFTNDEVYPHMLLQLNNCYFHLGRIVSDFASVHIKNHEVLQTKHLATFAYESTCKMG